MSSFYQRCLGCGKRFVEDNYRRNCECGGLLLFYYKDVEWENIPDGKYGNSVWRYHELLPLKNLKNALDIGVKKTPLIKSEVIAKEFALENLYIKVESENPTRTFKDREAFMTLSRLRELGYRELVTATTGDSGVAHARGASIVGMKLHVFLPENAVQRWESMVDEVNINNNLIKLHVEGKTFDQAIEKAGKFAERNDLPLEYGFYNQLRIEGMKTMGFEVLEELKRVPDWYIQTVASGVGVYGFNKACQEMYGKSPRLVGIQPGGCCPMVNAFNGKTNPEVEVVDTYAMGIAQPKLYPSYPYLRDIGCIFEAVFDGGRKTEKKEIPRLLSLYHEEGVKDVGVEATIALAGLEKLVREKMVMEKDVVVLCCSGGMRADLPWNK